MSTSDLAAFARGSICSTLIENAVQSRCGGGGLREVGAFLPDPHARATGVEEARAGPSYGHGAAAKGTEVHARFEAAAKRKMAVMPPLCKAEVLRVQELDAKPQWVYASLLALSTLLWRREVPANEHVSRF